MSSPRLDPVLHHARLPGAGRSLVLVGCVIAGVTGYMAYAGASSSWQYYLTVDEYLARPPAGGKLRVSGTIAPGSLRVSPGRDHASFVLRGESGDLQITCQGRLPDNLEENAEVVAEGELQGGRFEAHQVLTRCASKYTTGEPAAGRDAGEE